MQHIDEDAYESLKEELIGHYRRELAYIYSYHTRPPVEYYDPVKTLLPRLMLHLGERKLHDVLAECWRIAWYREPVCHPNERYMAVEEDEKR